MALSLALACGPDTHTSKADAPTDLNHADDQAQEDPWNCGELGAVCVGHLGIGECIDGQCGATLGECHRPPGDCNSICALDGRSCAELACAGATAFAWKAPLQDEADTLCALGHQQSATALELACDEPLDQVAMTVLCCCSP